MSKSYVLVIASHDAALKEYVQLFESINSLVPIFVIDYSSVLIDKMLSRGWIICNLGGEGVNKGKANFFTRNVKKFLKYFFDSTHLGCWLQSTLLKSYLSDKLRCRIERYAGLMNELVNDYRIASIVVSTDRSIGVEASGLLLGAEKKIKVIVLGFAYSADFQSCYKLRAAMIYHYFRGQYEKVVYHDSLLGDKVFYRPYEAKALYSLGILSDNPWVLGAGKSTVMLLDSAREKDRLCQMGGDPKKYHVTGLVSHDALYKSKCDRVKIKQELSDKYKLNSTVNIVISLPQYYEHGLCDRQDHFLIIQEMCHLLNGFDANILFSLHPKMAREEYLFVQEDFGFVLLNESLVNVLPAAALFLATYSSTVAWALMSDVPIILFDHIGLNYKNFYSEFFLPVAKTNRELKELLSENLNINQQSKSSSTSYLIERLSPFDGQCFSRIQKALS